MKRKESHIDFLLTHPEFVRWVRNPDPDLDSFWQHWLQTHPEAVDEVRKARTLILGISFGEKQADPARKDFILNEIIKSDSASQHQNQAYRPKAFSVTIWEGLGQWGKVAAILLFVLGFSCVLLLTQKKPHNPVARVLEAKWVEKKTAFGEKLNFNLSDGTVVWLNSGSTLRFPEVFDSLHRFVVLTGEAYFEVVPDTLRPFRVGVGSLVTEVVGTSFNVNSTHADNIQISLFTGKVSVHGQSSDENISLNPGQQLNYSISTQSSQLVSFQETDVLGWKNGVIKFDRASFAEVIHTLERWYGVTFDTIGFPKSGWSLTGTYKNQSLELVLDRMAFIEDFTYSMNNKTVTLKFQ